jgi:hypothetical protein
MKMCVRNFATTGTKNRAKDHGSNKWGCRWSVVLFGGLWHSLVVCGTLQVSCVSILVSNKEFSYISYLSTFLRIFSFAFWFYTFFGAFYIKKNFQKKVYHFLSVYEYSVTYDTHTATVESLSLSVVAT